MKIEKNSSELLEKQLPYLTTLAQKYLTSHPWRKTFIEQMLENIKNLLSSKKKEPAANILLEQLEEIVNTWECIKGNKEENNTIESSKKKDSNDSNEREISQRIASYLGRQQEILQDKIENSTPNSPFSKKFTDLTLKALKDQKDIWAVYEKWNAAEAGYWDSLCLNNLFRIKFFKNIHSINSFKEEDFGPYNQQYNIIRALKKLYSHNIDWLEKYLFLYGSLQNFEKTIQELSGNPEVK